MCRDIPNNWSRDRLQERLDQQFGGTLKFPSHDYRVHGLCVHSISGTSRSVAVCRVCKGSAVLHPIGVGPDSSAEQSVILRDTQIITLGSLLLDQLYNFGAPLTACIGLWNESARNMGFAYIHFRCFSAL